MSWWPFSRRSKSAKRETASTSALHIRGTRIWLEDLQLVCERHHEQPEAAKQLIRELQIEWREAHSVGEVSEELREGLELRALRLLASDATEWMGMLDDEDFWMPGWRPS